MLRGGFASGTPPPSQQITRHPNAFQDSRSGRFCGSSFHGGGHNVCVAQPPARTSGLCGFDWSGFYLGGQGGYTWNQATIFDSVEELDSGSAGLHAGYYFQSGDIVYGIENDFKYNFENK
ncbi:hypothetical protein [Agrobacterium larrymoorei]|uniref:Porin family protein n=1 Tax=Agrobacterium larrymoorei TaxID=160699 RepID=A0A4D7DXN2_9HYPH|nr:hypothetical protein [Agrobacterium larrymoorei]QCJ01039.1 hypothetical protein CFBP5473_24080 [Agrobacterium larrymoorei]QYA10374.1 hypothetical protein J5285_22735 [Agrobacterium larrymoorei]